MQKIYNSDDRVLLYLLKAKLADQGIEAIIRNEEPAGLAGGEVPPVVAEPELWILDDYQASQAMELIQEELARQTMTKQAWRCTKCGEQLEGQFEVCWKCGHSRP